MKVRASCKRICTECRLIIRKRTRRIVCPKNPKHKQRQG